jgi:hypothetical protein
MKMAIKILLEIYICVPEEGVVLDASLPKTLGAARMVQLEANG